MMELIDAMPAAFHHASATKSKVEPLAGEAQQCFAARVCSEFSLKLSEKKDVSFCACSIFALQIQRSFSKNKMVWFMSAMSPSGVTCTLAICYILYTMFLQYQPFNPNVHSEAKDCKSIKYKYVYHILI